MVSFRHCPQLLLGRFSQRTIERVWVRMVTVARLQHASKLFLHPGMVRNKRTKGAHTRLPRNPPVEGPRLQALKGVLLAHNHSAGDSHRVNVPVSILVDPHPRLLPILHLGRVVVEQVDYLFVVQLHELGADFELWHLGSSLLGLILPRLDPVKQVTDSPWDDSHRCARAAHLKSGAHCVCFPTPCLPVSKDGCVEPLKAALHQALCCVVVHLILLTGRVVDIVVREGFIGPDPGLGLSRGLEGADLASVNDLSGQLGADPHCHTDRASRLLLHPLQGKHFRQAETCFTPLSSANVCTEELGY